MAKFYILDRWSIEAGPQLGFELNAKSIIKNSLTDKKSENSITGHNTVDCSIGVGTSYAIIKGLGLSARYNFGLTKASGTKEFPQRNNVFQVGAYYKF